MWWCNPSNILVELMQTRSGSLYDLIVGLVTTLYKSKCAPGGTECSNAFGSKVSVKVSDNLIGDDIIATGRFIFGILVLAPPT
mmetsp:Transcript_6746/g.9400  ORF Transcript_6746/g.9400 Transcript_6746/m.9400 type:complete len:83 (-) Transcript_6746:144-392(-)